MPAASPAPPRWNFWIDRGGTFTDIVARRPDGILESRKLLSDNPGHYTDAALTGIRGFLSLPDDAPIPADKIASVKMGTTVATNALLERDGARVLLLTTKGFADALEIGYQNRPHLFRLNIEKPSMLFERVAEINERILADGTVQTPVDEPAITKALNDARRDGINSVAIVFVHGWRHRQHEETAAKLARSAGFAQVSVSHEVSPLIKMVARGFSTVADAYLTPILSGSIKKIADDLGADDTAPRLMFMTSSGGLTGANLFRGRDAVLSGPAGGVVGAAKTAELAGFNRIIGFDMGGTSTDVCHYAGEFERSFDSQVAGIHLRAPMMLIHTVAAGGGSLLSFDGARMRVGPRSAGADPGPACYRKNGPLTVTDANVMTGKLNPQFFPAIFGPGGDQPLDADVVRTRFSGLAEEIGGGQTPEEIADGFLRIAVENMAQAIKKISVQRGYDVRDHALNCFGGAAGQHACPVADALGIKKILIHPLAGVLSAYGIGLADVTAHREESIEIPLNKKTPGILKPLIDRFAKETAAELLHQDVASDAIKTAVHVHARYEGSDTALPVPLGDGGVDGIHARFTEAHGRRFGFTSEERPVVISMLSVESAGGGWHPDSDAAPSRTPPPLPQQAAMTRLYSAGEWHDAPVRDIAGLSPGHELPGPAIGIAPHATVVVEPGWRASLTPARDLLLTRSADAVRRSPVGTRADPVMLEIFNSLFMSIAEQMGATLEKTATSVNIKERLDFSCAVFDAAGNLVANAPHMPVHLGSMGASVREIMTRNPRMESGDVFVLNAPYNGGTHLPDVTVVAPVFEGGAQGSKSDKCLFYVASRGHHADIGGITPGSMPPFSRTVEEEGVLIDNFQAVSKGRFREKEFLKLLSSGKYPARDPGRNLSDLLAQIAACRKGQEALTGMVAHFTRDVVRAYMEHVQDNAEESVRRVIGALTDSSFRLEMDDGAVISVRIEVDTAKRAARIDFTGTSAQQAGNFNAPSAVTRAAVLYVFRCMVGDEIPMNEGCLKPLEIVIPEGSLLNPRYPAAVVAGNVETSQAVTDCLFGALGVMAAAQGTMNNLTFGNDRHQYYETICGGAGAGAEFDGADAVQTHMTNSRLTDPEVLEWRYPVVLDHFGVRRGTGGSGQHRGGDGAVRGLRFLKPMSVSILSNRRRVAPFGLAGGRDGAPGETLIRRATGAVEKMKSCDSAEMSPGDAIEIRTPGGGGYGKK